MLGIGGKFVGAKGMVIVPNISNLSRSAAQAAISAAGLKFFEVTTPLDTTDSAADGKVFFQSIASGSVVDYETEVSYSYYRYVAPPPVPSGPVPVGTPQKIESEIKAGADCRCEGTTQICVPFELIEISYRQNYSDGSFIITRAPSEDKKTIIEDDDRVIFQSKDCGAVCSATTWEQVGRFVASCNSDGQRIVTIRYKNGCGDEIFLKERTMVNGTYLGEDPIACCYKATLCDSTPFGSWSAYVGGVSTRSKTCYRSTTSGGCTAYTVTETRCQASCGTFGGGTCVNGKKTQTQTCTNADCSTYKNTRVVSCTGGAL